MFVLSTHGDQKRRGKMALDRAFCFGCLCVALTGPGLVIFGFTLFGVDDMLSSNLVLYNKVIERWNVAGRREFTSAEFSVNTTCIGCTHPDHSPRWAVLEKTTDPPGHNVVKAQYDQDDIQAHSPLFYRSNAPLMHGHRFEINTALNPQYRIDVDAKYLTPAARTSQLSVTIPIFTSTATKQTKADCVTKQGRWTGDSKTWTADCVVVQRLVAVCLRVMLDYEFKWRLTTSYSDKLGHGCWWSSGSATGASPAVGLQSALYAPLIEPDKAASFGGVSLTLRSIDDPALEAQRLSGGSLYLGRDVFEQKALGVMFWLVGVLFMSPCCIMGYVIAQGKKRKKHTKIMASVEEDDDGRAEAAATRGAGSRSGGGGVGADGAGANHSGGTGPGGGRGSGSGGTDTAGQGGGRLNELRRGAGSAKTQRWQDYEYEGEENAEQGSASGSRISVSEVGGKSASHGNGSGGSKKSGLPPKAMLNFAADLGIDENDVPEYMWLCEEALSPAVLGEWQPHVDEEGAVYYHNSATSSSRWEVPYNLSLSDRLQPTTIVDGRLVLSHLRT